ncbi:hypothetical protein [Thermosipho atlanticus]|uniref:Uncharacterized protein n=1 Tax=Thermosipho atlanticus DSM 15807 TaxID=1123380 RepID=A0A1M5U667_9BACT|nr:hypothetical protein [Thermosipho atlanticus]SHH58497.1 hypothetical protein SAMN02745199_1647 [Thermosipho atlanticus DSM 15807]
MRKIILVILLFFSVVSFTITIYPVVNRIDISSGTNEIKIIINVANSAPAIAEVEVEFSDFVIEGNKYLYDVGEYSYSIKNWMTSESTYLILQPGESIDYEIKLNIPRDFRGAQAFGAVHFKQKGGKTDVFETVFDYVSLIILDFPVQKNMRTEIIDAQVVDLTSIASESLINKYGNFGAVVELKIKNNGNAVLAVNGELRLISREINRIITSIPLTSNSFVVFPNRVVSFEYFVPFVLPRGKFEVQMDGISQGMRVTNFKRINITGEQPKETAVLIDPFIILIPVERTIENAKINIQNLSPKSLRFSLKTNSDSIEIFPSTIRLSPYTKINGFIKYDSRNSSLNDGDNIFEIDITSEEKIFLFKNPVIVLRSGELTVDCETFVTDVATNTFSINVRNTGNTILQGKIIRQDPLQTIDFTEEFVLFPNESKKFVISSAYNEIVKNSTFILFKKYGDKKLDQKKIIGEVKK